MAASVREELTDALDTKKYEKLESYARVAALKKRVVDAQPVEKQSIITPVLVTKENASQFL